MKNKLIALIMLNACASSAVLAAADSGTWYGGAKLGWSHYFDASGDEDFSDNLSNATDFDFSSDNVGGGVFGGYQILPWLAVEGGYDYLGNIQINGNNGVPGSKLENQGLQLSLKASYGLTESWDLYGRAGAMGYRAETQGAERSNFETGVRPLVALGTEYAFTDSWAGRLEYQWVSNVGNVNQIGAGSDVSTVTAGVVYRFGQSEPAPVAAPAAEPVVAQTPAQPQTFNLKSDVLFAFNSAKLSAQGQAAVRDLYNRPEIQAAKDKMTTVIGYSDRLGSSSYNQKLSAQRAQAVANELVHLGVAAENVQTEGRGAENSVIGTSCDAVKGRNQLITCMAPDRRVVIEITGK